MRLPSFPFIDALMKRFPKAGAYLVGGAVRDAMMKRPTKDFDFVVRNVAAKDLKKFLASLGRVDLVGKRFGVFKFRPFTKEGEPAMISPYDIALPRTEKAGMTGGYRDFDVQSDPELPLEKDLARRDFTVNAMAWDLKRKRLVDPFGGKKDVKAKTIRAVGDPDARFREDHSRMLRALRFAITLRFKIERKTWKAIIRHISHVNDEVAGHRTVAYEVAAREFMKAFSADPVKTMQLWRKGGALSELLPELAAMKERFHRVTHQPHVFMVHHETGIIAGLVSILAPLGAKAAAAVVERFKLASVEGQHITPNRVRRLVAGGEAARLRDEGVKPLVSANEIMKLLKIKPGPEVGRILDKVLLAQAQGRLKTKAQATRYVRDSLRRNRHQRR